MATTAIQLRRGNTAQHAAFTGLVGEITYETQKKTAVVHDGVTPGGMPLAGPLYALPFWYGFSSTASGAVNQAALTALIADLPSGAIIRMPEGSYTIAGTWTIDTPCTILGEGCTLTEATAGVAGISITSSDVKIRQLGLTGSQHASYVSAEKGIVAAGADYSHYLSGIEIDGCAITGWGSHGVELEYVEKSAVRHNYIYDCVRGGVVSYSANTVDASHNHVENITPGDGSSNAYGIVFAGDRHGQSTLMPTGHRAIGNYIKNVMWMGLQTEPACNTVFAGNTIVDCYHGLNFGSNISNCIYGSSHCTAVGNTIVNETLGTAVGFGIGTGGPSSTNPNIACVYSGNVVEGYGRASGEEGAGYFRFNSGMIFADNIIRNSIRCGLNIYQYNTGCIFEGNFIDTVASGGVGAIQVSAIGHNDDTVIRGNVLKPGGTIRAIYLAIADPLLRIGDNTHIGAGDFTNSYANALFKRVVNVTDCVTSSTTETTLWSRTVPAGTLGKLGWLKFAISGVKAGTNDTKTLKLYVGGSSWTIVAATAADVSAWSLEGEIRNTATNAQRVTWRLMNGAAVAAPGYQTASIDTAAGDTLCKLTGTAANGSDTVTVHVSEDEGSF